MFNKYKVSTGHTHTHTHKRFKYTSWASLVAQMVRNAGDAGSTPGSRRPLGEGNGYLLQYSCWENPMDRAA